jgi:DNA-binding FadR family transcriptional regulator
MRNIKRIEGAETSSGVTKVLDFFRDRLLAGDLKAGDRLVGEREMALALGVSRPVLREAMRSLAMLGLLDIQHGRGAFVRAADASVLGQALTLCLAPEPNVLEDVMQARIAIECQAIRLACVRAREHDLVAIAGTLDQLVSARDDAERAAEADHRFHLGIVRASASLALLKIYEAIGPLLLRSFVERHRDTVREPAIILHRLDAHREVFLSLRRRDPDDAERRLRHHFTIGDDLRYDRMIAGSRDDGTSGGTDDGAVTQHFDRRNEFGAPGKQNHA